MEIDDDNYLSVLVIKHDDGLSNGFSQRYQIIIPEGYGVNILRRFSY